LSTGFKGIGSTSLRDLAKLRDAKRMRVSSWDRTGGNDDFRLVGPGETLTMVDVKGPGLINHIWMTLGSHDPAHLRKFVLRMYWDGEETPSVEVPIGDFFGMGHGMYMKHTSLPLQTNTREGRGMNCFFPMPFEKSARITFTNESDQPSEHVYYYFDYETYDELEPGLGRFHAQWRRENPTTAILPSGANLDGNENYVILEAEGKGHYVGCNMNIDAPESGWYGEGDDMIFIDGEPWPPRLHGTGTEDYFNTAFCPNEEFAGPYAGLTLVEKKNWSGKTTMYRFHVEDPITFEKSIKVTIEHGHANDLANDYSSTAYWYQTEPHAAFPTLPPSADRLPGE
jgi:hypothetical protein